MNRYLIEIEYNGAAFNGWQRQDKDSRTVEGELEDAIFSATGERVTVHGSGRTDSGVHAIGQTAHFDLEKDFDAEKIRLAINYYASGDVVVKSSEKVDSDFHARYDVKRKTYLYRLYLTRERRPLLEGYAANCPYPLDVEKMREAAGKLIGEHDFKCMMSVGSSVKTTVRTIYNIDIEEIGEELYVYVTGNGFLYNMVRIIVGTLVDIGRGKLDPGVIDEAFSTGKRELAGTVMKASGLYLYKVEY